MRSLEDQSVSIGWRRILLRVVLVLPGLLALVGVVMKSYLSGWPVGFRTLLVFFVALAYMAAFSFVERRLFQIRLALLGWSSFVGILCLVPALAWARKTRQITPEKPTGPFMIGNAVAGYMENGPPWWANYAEEFKRSWHLRWHAYLRWRRQPFAGEFIHVDAAGRRKTWNPLEKNPKSVRLFILGGSTIWGNFARDDQTIPSRISHLLNEAGFATEVTNCGEAGYVTAQNLIDLMLELRRGNTPDIVVLYQGVNDIFSAFQNRQPGLPQNEARMSEVVQKSYDQYYEILNGPKLLKMDSPKKEPAVDEALLAKQEIDYFFGVLTILEALAERHRFQLFSYLQPVAYVGKPLTPAESREAQKYGPEMSRFFQRAYGLAKDRPDPPRHFHDLSGIFGGMTNSLFMDFCHVNEAGDELVAKAISADILRQRKGHN